MEDWLLDRATPEPTSGCWLWTKAVVCGYGLGNVGGRTRRVHRVALESRLGRSLRLDECALHSCDQPSCVNPRHLRPGTHQDNVNDRQKRGRGVRNEQRSGIVATPGSNRKITIDMVRWAWANVEANLPKRKTGAKRVGTWSWVANQLGVSVTGLRDAVRKLS